MATMRMWQVTPTLDWSKILSHCVHKCGYLLEEETGSTDGAQEGLLAFSMYQPVPVH
jgi:hypothetical protein